MIAVSAFTQEAGVDEHEVSSVDITSLAYLHLATFEHASCVHAFFIPSVGVPV